MAEDNKHIDDYTGIETTGHSWDGIKELNNPLPRWWLWTFYATVFWALVYTILYPAWPMLNGATKGYLGWNSRADLATSMNEAQAAQAVYLDKLAVTEVSQIAADPELAQFAISGGAAAFKINCVQCHGSGAAGSPGYPNLNDDDWLWGGTPDDIFLTLQHGIRFSGDDDTRLSEMPAYGADEILTGEEISDVAWYVRKISGQEFDAAAATRGETTFADNCAACHGETGEGVMELGGPNLADQIWIYGGEQADIVAQLNKPRMGVMPAWQERLGDTTLKQLTAFVHSLGGGQ